jgi:hypothetical protein
MDELSKTYTLAHSPDGWRVHFSTGIAPGFGLEPHHNLFDLIDRIETLYPEYQPRLTATQRTDYQLQVARRGYAQELQKMISQTSDLKDGLIDLTKKFPEIGAGQDREIPEDLTTLHHQQLSDLRAHVDIARREVALGRRVGQGDKGVGWNGLKFTPSNAFMRGHKDARGLGCQGIER